MKKMLLLAVVSLATAVMYAGGYRVSLQGQKSLAMGHTGVAVVNSSELVFFNPAGLVYLENKLNVSAGVSGVFSNVSYQNEATGASAITDSPVGTPLYFYASYKATDWLALGVGVYTPYGSSVEYADDWAGSHLVNNIDLKAIYIQPTVSLKINDKFSVGGGPIFVTGSVNFNRNLNRTLSDIDGNRSEVTVEAKGVNATGWTASAMFNPTDKLRIGATYRSEIIMEARDGDATFENVPNSPLTPFPATTTFHADLPLPAEMTVGLSYEFCDKWLFAFDLNRTFWDVYESLDIDFASESVPDSKNARNYKNSSIYRFGLQYEATKMFTLRGGYYFDESPVQAGRFAPETPRNDSSNFTAGLTVNVGKNLQIDASFLYSYFKEVEASYDAYYENGNAVPFGGRYKTNAFVPGLGLTYRM
ncbi:OmpP1/FadL family transporter [Ulvibacter litoralis]|uniref:Long-chain fatty acid transport protein n=1 Tax=Ulvibacter litoralis TaxID=227084 RepID=A0A1G7J785_9FLAO|nr:outer membrane protein transport protein [Ulvibacter litoralis]GHC64235.1 fatty acid transporter [Ulvibacter litoralis]SDF20857.1 long-chain fatty acid transport protein [Ulvibacter litoralis]